jgi:uncharacterized protein (TIGR02145 family)
MRHRLGALMLVLLSGSVWSGPEPVRKLALALMPLQGRALDTDALDVLGSTLASELVSSGQVRVLERSQMEQILQEQGFQQSGACDGSECAVQIGKLLTVDRILLGNVGRFGNAYSLSLRLVDVQSGEILRSVSKSIEGPQEAILTKLAPQAVRELLGTPTVPTVPAVPVVVVPDPFAEKKGTFKDPRDRKTYPWVRLGSQVWMARNLAWDTTGTFCYNDLTRHCTSYGRMYQWDLARRACPEGWRLPALSDMDTLQARFGGPEVAGNALKSNHDWDGKDDVGFRLLPGGNRQSNGEYSALEGAARLWLSTRTADSTKALTWFLAGGNPRVLVHGESPEMAASVRCLKIP